MPVSRASVNSEYLLRDSGYSNGDDSASMPRHRWYAVKESFSPHLVARAIWETGGRRGQVIYDPFCGSGTVPLVAASLGMKGIGFEVNPFLAFVAQTKLRGGDASVFSRFMGSVAASIHGRKRSPLEGFSTFGHKNVRGRWLFNTPILRCFEEGYEACSTRRTNVAHLARLCLIAAAMDCCNAKRDGKCLRYKPKWKHVSRGKPEFLKALVDRGRAVTEDLFTMPLTSCQSRVFHGDCRTAMRAHALPKFRLCVTSPPYLNSFDYTDIYRPELFLGRFIDGKAALKALRHDTIRSHVQVNWERATQNDFGRRYARSVAKVRKASEHLWDVRIPLMIQAYFEDMACVLKTLRGHAAPKARLWLVVATSAYAGVEIPVDLIIADIGQKVGWRLKEVGLFRDLRSSGQHQNRANGNGGDCVWLRETVVIMEAGT
ncbi:hypothetical protein LCGC14_1790110 [marine sediment metagenome]|uniref:DNA methylase N-4/N-6 domain-containing protein n=1 Tax=marine sediment metagenome TaxID=412755 RepID=A0A0F9GST5_9ZZZZ